MEYPKIIGKTRRKLCNSCVVIELVPGAVLRRGMTLKFEHEAGGIGNHGYYDETHQASSIQVNREDKDEVSCQDGLCAIFIGLPFEDMPPNGCLVLVINDQAPADQLDYESSAVLTA